MIRYQWSTHDLTSGQYSGSYDGIDISRHQGRIHWDELSKVKRLKFIYVKATEGATIKDPWYEANINQARKAEEPNKKEKRKRKDNPK
ncbi:GH25 family lysozyme [Prevotella copri]|jgi:lysozyme|uniref:GH25 family lysozyme n=1 Tax=Segatella copri TaxID=165179 RepID=A0AAP3BCS6_9BACT|nr:GH25 family lysozyme [Segatella copri]MCW4128268.1 GH25 family lysozyme [Segatella copri]MCW4415776.1 GH25 family lysozyme [Segatella copri]MCW4421364.1 GH25 family lysozyme [Segatella copri]